MHRVVNLTSECSNASGHKSNIVTELAKYDLYVNEVNTGIVNGSETLGVNVDFNISTEANTFHDWLKQYVQNNSLDFTFARTRIHDCYHASGENLPCKLGDTWELV